MKQVTGEALVSIFVIRNTIGMLLSLYAADWIERQGTASVFGEMTTIQAVDPRWGAISCDGRNYQRQEMSHEDLASTGIRYKTGEERQQEAGSTVNQTGDERAK